MAARRFKPVAVFTSLKKALSASRPLSHCCSMSVISLADGPATLPVVAPLRASFESVNIEDWNLSSADCISSPPRSGGNASERIFIGVTNSRSSRETDCAEPMFVEAVSSLIRSQRPGCARSGTSSKA